MNIENKNFLNIENLIKKKNYDTKKLEKVNEETKELIELMYEDLITKIQGETKTIENDPKTLDQIDSNQTNQNEVKELQLDNLEPNKLYSTHKTKYSNIVVSPSTCLLCPLVATEEQMVMYVKFCPLVCTRLV